jgi:DNA (cytosine-5)-methyltransferase 1
MGKPAYYNEFDPYAAEWLRNLIARNLIPPGDVDTRSIVDVQPSDLTGYAQCHFFAGIGGWPRALRVAGWPDDRPVWTGSCPCQPISSAARGRNKRLECERHLWPVWRELIAAARPGVIFGEQVAQASDWHSVVGDDLEALGYAFGSAHLPSVSIGKDHLRFRFYFVGYADREGQPGRPLDVEMARMSRDRGFAGSVVPANGLPDRVAVLRAFGNAIDPELAAEFIAAAAHVS